jgi:cell division septum initiation protein DivIVA
MSTDQIQGETDHALPGNQWVSQLRQERDRGDRAEATLHLSEAEADDLMLRATEAAEVLLVFAQDVASRLLATAQVEADGVLFLAEETARQLVAAAEANGCVAPSGATPVPSRMAVRIAEDVVDQDQAAAVKELIQRQAVAAEVLLAAQADARAILEVGRTQTPTG